MPNPPWIMAGYTSAGPSAACHVAVVPRRHAWRGIVTIRIGALHDDGFGHRLPKIRHSQLP